MDNNTTTNQSGSIPLFLFGHVSYLMSILTAGITLDLVFKLLSIVSVGMVIIINAKKMIKEIKKLMTETPGIMN